MWKGWFVVGLLASGCGRLWFDVVPTSDAPSEPLAPSCAGLAAMCGATGKSPCCESPVLPGTTFYRSYDGVGFNDMSSPATVSTFHLDTYEVTVGRYRQFVQSGLGTQQNPPAAGSGAHAQILGSGWDSAWNANLPADSNALRAEVSCDLSLQTWTDAPAGNENRPMNCLDWYDAFAFCIWDGGYLPTEAEWNFAASGGNLQRALPWSIPSTSLALDDSTYASYYVDATKECMGDGVAGCTVNDLVPVGSKPFGDAAWGHADLAGNVWEWSLDWHAATYLTPCSDCANLVVGTDRVGRGGALNFSQSSLRASDRYHDVPDKRVSSVGVRCARPF